MLEIRPQQGLNTLPSPNGGGGALTLAGWTEAPDLHEHHVEALAQPSPRDRASGVTERSLGSSPQGTPRSRSSRELVGDVEAMQRASTTHATSSAAVTLGSSADGVDDTNTVGGTKQAATAESHNSSMQLPKGVGHVKTVVRKKTSRDLDDLHYVQKLGMQRGAVWVLKFSQDGKYLASGGQDTIVRIFRAYLWAGLDPDQQTTTTTRAAATPDDSAGMGDSDGGSGGSSQDGKDGKERLNGAQVTGTSAGDPGMLDRSGSGALHRSGSPEPGSEISGGLPAATLAAQRVFEPEPMLELKGHRHDVLDIAWSKNNFLLSASMDHTVLLWHTSTPVCLRSYAHKDFVTAVQFHPADDTMFLTGSLDSCIRVWHIPSHRVVSARELAECVTAAAFNPAGNLVVAGTFQGNCVFFQFEATGSGSEVSNVALRPLTQLNAASASGSHPGRRVRRRGGGSKGGGGSDDSKKITAISFRPGLFGGGGGAGDGHSAELMPEGDEVLVTSNDSRVRLYLVRWAAQGSSPLAPGPASPAPAAVVGDNSGGGGAVETGSELTSMASVDFGVQQTTAALSQVTRLLKFSGHANASSQLKASFSFDGRYVMCGSDDHCVYIWRTETEADSKHPDWQKRWEKFQGVAAYCVCTPRRCCCARHLQILLATQLLSLHCVRSAVAAHTSSVTAAIWAPPTIRVPTRQALLQGSSATGVGTQLAEQEAEAEAGWSAEQQQRQDESSSTVIVTAGFSGTIKVFCSSDA